MNLDEYRQWYVDKSERYYNRGVDQGTYGAACDAKTAYAALSAAAASLAVTADLSQSLDLERDMVRRITWTGQQQDRIIGLLIESNRHQERTQQLLERLIGLMERTDTPDGHADQSADTDGTDDTDDTGDTESASRDEQPAA